AATNPGRPPPPASRRPAARHPLHTLPPAEPGRPADGRHRLRDLPRRGPVLRPGLRDEGCRAGPAGGAARPLGEELPELPRGLLSLAEALPVRREAEGHRPLDGRAAEARRSAPRREGIRVLDARFLTTPGDASGRPRPSAPGG